MDKLDQNLGYSAAMEVVSAPLPTKGMDYYPDMDYQAQQSFENLGALAKVFSPYGWGSSPSQIFYR